MSSLIGGKVVPPGSGELAPLLGGVLNGEILSSSGSVVLAGASDSLTCLAAGPLLKIFGFPARLIGGGSFGDGAGLSGSLLTGTADEGFKRGAECGGRAGESFLLGGGSGGFLGIGDAGRDILHCPLSPWGPPNDNGVNGRRSDVFGGDPGDSTITFGGDRGGDRGPMEIGRGREEFLEEISGINLSFPNCRCARTTSRGGEFFLEIGRGMSREKRPSGRTRCPSCPSPIHRDCGDGCRGMFELGPLVGEVLFDVALFSKRLRKDDTGRCELVRWV